MDASCPLRGGVAHPTTKVETICKVTVPRNSDLSVHSGELITTRIIRRTSAKTWTVGPERGQSNADDLRSTTLPLPCYLNFK